MAIPCSIWVRGEDMHIGLPDLPPLNVTISVVNGDHERIELKVEDIELVYRRSLVSGANIPDEARVHCRLLGNSREPQ